MELGLRVLDDGTGDEQSGNYVAVLTLSGGYRLVAEVRNYDRSLGAVRLLREAIVQLQTADPSERLRLWGRV